NANYEFAGLAPGNYNITVTPPAGFVPTSATTIAVAATTADTVYAGVNFFVMCPVASIGCKVFYDVNCNGVFDAGIDAPLAGVKVRLMDAAGTT
ncbi:hypothetical protein, partial [Streptococcus pneumoniae]|uniref:hypothetical protein n=1 Tax=Streptococcus pneumoniae TaxID=1313 RepID=UPI0018B098CD